MGGICVCSPLLFFVVLFILVPVLGTLVDSFFRDVTYLLKKFIGLENFVRLVHDPGFLRAFCFSCLFVLVSVPLETLLGLMIALVINEHAPAWAFADLRPHTLGHSSGCFRPYLRAHL